MNNKKFEDLLKRNQNPNNNSTSALNNYNTPLSNDLLIKKTNTKILDKSNTNHLPNMNNLSSLNNINN